MSTEPNNNAAYYEQVEADVLAAMQKPRPAYWLALLFSLTCFGIGLACWGWQIWHGMRFSGKNNPVGWFMYITDFVFWVGIAHSGTLISAVLFLFRAKFRKAFNRTAEAMTVIAVLCAGLFPLIHLGRVWLFYWLPPYPNQRMLWSNFRSPLLWDVFAVSTYLTVSAIFFYVGLLPDLAVARRRVTGIRQWIYRILSIGWRGTAKQWSHYEKLYGFLAAFATPLVISVHSVVSWDFAMSVIPGWHTTIFAPYFVAGAIFSGCAMVITLMAPMRYILRLEKYVTVDHFEAIAKVLLFTSLIVGYAYILEYAMAFYSGNVFEIAHFKFRLLGDFKYAYWLMCFCNVLLPLTLFVRKLRRNIVYLVVVSLFVNVGMWLERFVIIVTSLAHDFQPYAWGNPNLSLIAIGITVGSFGMFFTFFLIFVKILPVLSVTELKEERAHETLHV
jgi:molybdopterin-containing oxidoreductase family membrane subunit